MFDDKIYKNDWEEFKALLFREDNRILWILIPSIFLFMGIVGYGLQNIMPVSSRIGHNFAQRARNVDNAPKRKTVVKRGYSNRDPRIRIKKQGLFAKMSEPITHNSIDESTIQEYLQRNNSGKSLYELLNQDSNSAKTQKIFPKLPEVLSGE